MNNTLHYYEKNAEIFADGTLKLNFSLMQNRFLSLLPKDAKILDFGCGAGRDTKYFLQRGYEVAAIDGSAALCNIATQNTGIPVKNMLFQDFCEIDAYDGIWACASLLHLTKDDLKNVIQNVAKALKPRGVLYASFKYGDFEGQRNGRYYLDLNEGRFKEILLTVPELSVLDTFVSNDVRSNRDVQWFNVVLRRVK